MMTATERLLRYVQIDSASHEEAQGTPSSQGQWDMARFLEREMRDIGMQNVRVDEHCYVYGEVPGNAPGEGLGLIAHLDTVDVVPSSGVRPRIVKYQGGGLRLENGETLEVADNPFLARLEGQELIVTDGNTLLGADDKAGVAEIMTLCETLIQNPDIPHGRVAVCFTPDEEIGGGAGYLDIPAFGVPFAYTVDGGELGEIECENFNAASARVEIRGISIHPGSAKNRMVNAALIAAQFAEMLPAAETPSHTEGREGFYHLTQIEGCEERASLRYILRDHDAEKLEAKKRRMVATAAYLNESYGPDTVKVEIADSYRNMLQVLKDRMEIVERAKQAMRAADVEPVIVPIRGGTDGAQLTFRGLPCPNLSTGGFNFHSRRELIPVRSLEKMVRVLVELVRAR